MPATRKIVDSSFRAHTIELALEGDSRISSSYTGAKTKRTTGLAFWIEFLTRCRVSCPYNMLFGVGGAFTADVAGRAAAVAATAAAGVVLLVSTNDTAGNNPSLAQRLINLSTAINTYLDAGKMVFIIPELPRGGGNVLSGTALKEHLRINQWLQRWRNVPGCYVADPWLDIIDQTSAGAAIDLNYSYDGLHLNVSGNYFVAKAVADIINVLFPEPLGILPSSAADLCDLTSEPSGNLIANGMFKGTGGTASTGASGTFADSTFNYANHASFTFAGAKVTTGKKVFQQATLSGTPTNSNPEIYLTQGLDNAKLAAGDVIEGFAEVEWNAGAANVYVPALRLYVNASSFDSAFSGGGTGFGYCPNIALSGVIRTPPITIPAGTPSGCIMSLDLYGAQNLAPTGVFRVGRTAVRRLVAGDK